MYVTFPNYIMQIGFAVASGKFRKNNNENTEIQYVSGMYRYLFNKFAITSQEQIMYRSRVWKVISCQVRHEGMI